MSPTLERPAARRVGSAALSAPRMLMSWEDWLTFAAALVAFLAVAVSIQQARWVPGMPSVVMTMLSGLVVGLFAARIRMFWPLRHLVALAIGAGVILLAVQSYADGATIPDRVEDVRLRLVDWFHVVRANEISNDRLPFVTIVQSACWLSAYIAAYAIYRWHNPWLAILPGGVVLLANVSLQRGQPTAALVVFLFGAMLLIARLHLQGLQARWKKDRVDYPEFISLDAGQLTLGLLAALVIGAWLLPSASETKSVVGVYDAVTSPFTGRSGAFDRLFHNITGRGSGRLHDFGTFLPIRGDVSLGTRRLYEVVAPQVGYLRATSYDEYTGKGWKVSDRDRTRVEGGDLAAAPEVAQFASRAGVSIEVTVLDPDHAILTYGIPLGTNERTNAETAPSVPWDIEKLGLVRGLRGGDVYHSLGSVSIATPEELQGAGTAYPPAILDRYLQLPKGLPDRVRDEARQVTATARTPYEAAVLLEEYIRSFPYSTQVPATPHNRDAVDFFLFDLRAGYFDYTATAMAVMLRSVGVPARVATGYVLDPADATGNRYLVRRNDSYTWVEVFFPGYGWVDFNPTVDRPGSTAGFGPGAEITTSPEALTGPELEQLFGEIGAIGPELQGILDNLATEPAPHNDPPWTLIYSLIGALTALVAVVVASRITWNWGLAGLEGPARLWARIERAAGWARLGSRPAETPREFSSRLGTAIDHAPEASVLRAAYERQRYGRPGDADPAAISEDVAYSYTALRNALLKLLPRVRVPGRRRP